MGLTFGTENEDILWMGEAIDTGTVKPGTKSQVETVSLNASGTGFTVTAFFGKLRVSDFVWAKSPAGRSLSAGFASIQEFQDSDILLTAQKKQKNAQLSIGDTAVVVWMPVNYDDDGVLRSVERQAPVKKGEKQTSPT